MTAVEEPRAAPRTRYVGLVGLGLLGLAICAALWTIGPGRQGEWVPVFVRGYVVAWVCYVAAAVVVSRWAQSARGGSASGVTRCAPTCVTMILIIAGALAMRLVTYAHAPVLSTDSYRYLWDGRVTNAGINPYRYRPNAPELRRLRNANWRPIAYKNVATVYPPGAELLFAGLARIRSSDRAAFFWTFILFDMGSVLLIAALLRRTGRPPERVIWYAWSPLVITEVAGGGHADAAGLFFLLLALLLIARQGRAGASSALTYAASVLAKGPSAITLPFFVARGGWRFLAICAVAVAALSAPFLGAGARMFSGVYAYLQFWQTNAGIFRFLCWILEKTDPVHMPRLMNGTPNYIPLVRFFTTALLLYFVVVVTRYRRPTMEWLLAAVFGTLGVQLLLGAPVLPWYVIWTVPALCWWNVPGWLLFTLSVSACYYTRWMTPANVDNELLWIIYVPVYALLVGQWVWGRARGERAEESIAKGAGIAALR